MLPGLVAQFTAKHPDAHVKMINRTSEEVRSFFPAASIDIGIAELPIDIAGVDVRRYQIGCVAILPTGHAASRKDTIAPSDLSGEPFLAMPTERLISHRLRAAFAQEGAVTKTVAEVDFFSSICAIVASGGGVSVVDACSAKMFAALGLVVRPFRPAIPYEIGVFTSADRPPSGLSLSFLDMLDAALTSETIR